MCLIQLKSMRHCDMCHIYRWFIHALVDGDIGVHFFFPHTQGYNFITAHKKIEYQWQNHNKNMNV